MAVLFYILLVVFLVGCVGLVGAILLQKKRSAGGMGSIAGMGNVSDTYWDKNKRRSAEGALEMWTKIGAAVLSILAVVLCLPIFG
ncbi:MAG: preprotein translocase subunit SecG [Defluviitaleaceae bacterium]|nr:preprotein translocase subunit SecG [Defluviitaleaceae bacterium]MCL2262109.1 preprotein translocase subunit SecG [Defluviitaleaceae bacterium]